MAFVFAGNFLSTQVANSLFNERREQALEESSRGFQDVQRIFDNAVASDQEQVQQLVEETLTILETRGADAKRQWILIPVTTPAGQGYVGPMSQNEVMSSSSVPRELQEKVAEESGVYWQSASLPLASGEEPVPVLIVGSKIRLNDTTEYGLYLVYDLSSSQATLSYIQSVIIIGFAILLIFVGTIVWWVTRSVIRPISQTAGTAQRLAAGDLDQRVIVRGENEAATLGNSFNEMAENIQQQIVQLETLSTMQQQFVSDVSHELRTPLTTVKMAAELLYTGRDQMQPNFARSTELMYHQVERFEALLADLLEISRFDAGSATLDVSTVEIRTFVDDAINAVRPHLERRGIEVRLHGAEDICRLEMDTRRIDRVLRNLLVNAIEHSEGRPIDVYLGHTAHDVAVAVRDHGVGMTSEQARRAFDRFWRADPSRKRTLGGTGLGLAIAAEDVRLHGGRLEAWGELGQGACFRLTLPRGQGEPAGDSPLGLPPEGIPAIPARLAITAAGDGDAAAPGNPEQPQDEEDRDEHA